VIVKGQCNVETLTSVVQAEVPGAQLESQVGAELSYLLPEDQAKKFPELFRKIETQKDKLGINSFGATATTMEEVFLKYV
jgi:ATP-binding cassette subfamily A (ABC1) protein 3